METLDLIVLSGLSLLVAGTIKGLAGLGLPTASAGIMTLFIAPRTAIAIIVIPMLFANAWQCWRAGGIASAISRYTPFALALAVLLFITVNATASAPDRLIFAVLGLSILSFCIVNLLVTIPRLPDRLDRPAQILAGCVAGVLGGLSGVWAAPMVFYLTARQVEKDEFIRATGLFMFIGTVPLILGYIQQGFLTPDLALIGTLMIAPAILGFSLGERLRRGMSSERFRVVFLWIFMLLGLNLLRRGIF